MKAFLIFTFLFTSLLAFGQTNSQTFKDQILASDYIVRKDIKNEFIGNDISSLLTRTENSRVFGFIGDNYQRIRIVLISVIKNKDNPSQYLVYGKSKVKDNVCEFQGTITITNVFNFREPEFPGINQGKVIGEYVLYENPDQKHVGVFKGVFSSDWYFNKEGTLLYDDRMDEADGFTNNEFVGTWTSYSGTITKVCNWGDQRIPMSGDLDVGTGEFVPNKKYQENGWLTYMQAFGGGSDKSKEAATIERAAWWK